MKIENNIFTPSPQEILSIEPITPIEWNFRIHFNNFEKINYGQFVQVSLPGIGEAPISITDFSRKEEWIELLIRKVGKVTDQVFKLKAGEKLFLRGPYGNGFPFDEKFKERHLVIVAGGSGCGPVRSMINEVHKQFKSVEQLDLILGFKDNSCILFHQEIEQWKENVNLILTVDKAEEGDEKQGIVEGLVTEHIDSLDLAKTDDIEVVIVGPPPMMRFTALEFEKRGIPDEQIWLSFERKMSCAIGKCGHCKIDETYICLEGPVFSYDVGKTLID